MSCIDGVFHICDNEEPCKELPLPHSSKLHIDEIFLPNRRNILGGIQISVTRQESVAFRAAATSPDLEMVATLRTISADGRIDELSKCSGKGEIFWPYIRLEPSVSPHKSRSISGANLNVSRRDLTSVRSLMNKGSKPYKASPSSKNRSVTKVKPILEPKLYSIQVVCPWGWPLTLIQWRRVDEVRNSQEFTKLEMPTKKILKDTKPQKPGSAKDKEKEKEKLPIPFQIHLPQPGDAFVELECALAFGGGAQAKRDDDRDMEFAAARKSWDAREHGRNQRGAQIRKEFRTEFLEAPPPQPVEISESSAHDETYYEEVEGEEFKKDKEPRPPSIQLPGPSPVTESGMYYCHLKWRRQLKKIDKHALRLLWSECVNCRLTTRRMCWEGKNTDVSCWRNGLLMPNGAHNCRMLWSREMKLLIKRFSTELFLLPRKSKKRRRSNEKMKKFMF